MSKPKLDQDEVLDRLKTITWARDPRTTPPVRFDLKAGSTTFEFKSRPIPWQLSLAKLVCSPFGIVVEPAKGNDLVLFGEAEEISRVYPTLTTLLRDLGPLADQEYLVHFYQCKEQGDVEAARGYRAKWLDQTLDLIRTSYLPAPAAIRIPTMTLVEAYRDDKAQAIATRRAEPKEPVTPKPRAVPEALIATVAESRAVGEAQEAFLTRIYRGALEAAGYQETSLAEGVAFNPALKGFSIVAAMNAAAKRLGVNPDRFRFKGGYLYLSSAKPVPDNPSLTFPQVMEELGQALLPTELQALEKAHGPL